MVEFDPVKDAANIAKHGVSLGRADQIDLGKALIEQARSGDDGEARWIAYGHLQDRLHILVFTRRDMDLRAISLRKANRREQRHFRMRTASPV